MARILALMVVVLAVSACSPDQPGPGPQLTLTCDATGDTLCIAPFRAPCHGPFAGLCYRLVTSTSTETSLMYDSIEGFEYQWGHSYQIDVHAVSIPNPPEDSTGRRVILDRIVSDTTVAPGTHFTVQPWPDHIRGTAGTDLALVGEPLLCVGDTCDALEDARQGTERFELELSFPQVEGGPLVVEDVR